MKATTMARAATIHELCPANDGIETPALAEGTLCGPYKVMRRLAVGGVGDVYEAEHTVLGRRAALKVLQVRHANRSELAERLAQEARVLSEIRHPCMVTVYDAGVLQGVGPSSHPLIWMAMEYLNGRTLRDTLWPNRRLAVAQALSTAIQIAQGIMAAHAAGAVHRDLKPENVMLCSSGRTVVLDLGTAKYLRSTNLRPTQRVMGTVAYMSPEHLMGEDVDFRSDVYSLGLVVWEMLAGYHPFSLSNSTAHLPSTLDLARCQIEVMPQPLHEVFSDLPSFLWDVVAPALQKTNSERYENMGAFEHALGWALKRVNELSHQTEGPPPAPSGHDPPGHGPPAPVRTEVLPEQIQSPPEDPTRTLIEPATPEVSSPRSPSPKKPPSAAGRALQPRRPRGLSPEDIQRALEHARSAAGPPRRRARWYRHWLAAALFGSSVGATSFYLLVHRPQAEERARFLRQSPTAQLNSESEEPTAPTMPETSEGRSESP